MNDRWHLLGFPRFAEAELFVDPGKEKILELEQQASPRLKDYRKQTWLLKSHLTPEKLAVTLTNWTGVWAGTFGEGELEAWFSQKYPNCEVEHPNFIKLLGRVLGSMGEDGEPGLCISFEGGPSTTKPSHGDDEAMTDARTRSVCLWVDVRVGPLGLRWPLHLRALAMEEAAQLITSSLVWPMMQLQGELGSTRQHLEDCLKKSYQHIGKLHTYIPAGQRVPKLYPPVAPEREEQGGRRHLELMLRNPQFQQLQPKPSASSKISKPSGFDPGVAAAKTLVEDEVQVPVQVKVQVQMQSQAEPEPEPESQKKQTRKRKRPFIIPSSLDSSPESVAEEQDIFTKEEQQRMDERAAELRRRLQLEAEKKKKKPKFFF